VLSAEVRLANGETLSRSLGRIEVVEPDPAPPARTPVDADTIAICMATFEPDPELLAIQLDSIRAQTDERWICLVSDDASSPAAFDRIGELTAGDDRFTVSRGDERLGPYLNFERALRMVPPEAELIALSDQDDRWYPDKLATLRAALGPAQLAYSDQRLVSADGRLLRPTLWQGRRRDHASLASLLIANSVPGAAMLLRRGVAELALPFPQTPAIHYHDHWLALAALASGEIAYVDRPLYDYVQHAAAVQGELVGRRLGGPRGRGGRAAYFCGYVPRAVQARTLLVRLDGALEPRKRRALERFTQAASSPLSFAWLALRPLRRLVGRSETLGEELGLARGLAWRRLARALARDTRFPDPPVFDQPRLRRWRAGP
jgi:hypothetical protein